MRRSLLFVAVIALAVVAMWNVTPRVAASRSRRQPNESEARKSSTESRKKRIAKKFAGRKQSAQSTAETREVSRFEGRLALADDDQDGDDPDRPRFLKGRFNAAEYLIRRAEHTALLRGYEPGRPFDPSARLAALSVIGDQERSRTAAAGKNRVAPEVLFDWAPIGPAPVPNGQTQTTTAPVSGRVTAIDVHPTDPLIAYVGTAQGGVYRTSDGGTTWTQLMFAAAAPGAGFSPAGTLAIGAITVDPVTPTTVFVGTGEGNLSLDSYFGVGIYRITNADTTPVVQGPFETRTNGGGGHAFAGTAISRIIIDPANDNNMFVGNTLGFGGISGSLICCGSLAPVSAFVGLYFSSNAQAATPTWVRVTSLPGGGVAGSSDIAIDPTNANVLVVGQQDFGGGGVPNSGIFSSTNALSGVTATFIKPVNFAGSQPNIEFAAYKPAGSPAVFYAATAESNGNLRTSTDGGATFSAAGIPGGAVGFCDGQCFYDIAIAVDPGPTAATGDDILYLGGNVRGVSSKLLDRSDDGGATFSHIDNSLHADSHAIRIAPSDSNVVYTGNDGGVWRSDNAKAAPASVAWTDANTASFSATQFESIDVHPTDPDFMIGGTQDNGTLCFGNCGGNSSATWIRADFGDGGFSVIDQNATDTTNVTMYHTYFNSTGQVIGYARVDTTADATEGNWVFKGCNGVSGNDISCTDRVLFYAPLVRGPGSPNTIYFGTDRLYRSANKGDNHTVVSQAPLSGTNRISAIGVSPQDDNFRIAGLENGALFFTTTGSSVLASLDPVGTGSAIPDKYVARIVFDPTNKNTAYIALDGYTGTPAGSPSTHVWRVTNLATTPVITSINGSSSLFLPDIPVNALAVDPARPARLLAGTDVGVYISEDGGGTWTPFGNGLPRVAVFGMAITSGRLLRVATHGLGVWQISLPLPTATSATISGSVVTTDLLPVAGATIRLSGAKSLTTITDSSGVFRFEKVDIDSFYTVTPELANYSFNPSNRSFSLVGNKSDVVFTTTPDAIITSNAIDSTEYFVRQQYVDFLGREPDQGGFDYWSARINECGNDTNCVRARRIDVSAAFFVEPEFQDSGSFIYRLYKAGLGRQLTFSEFSADHPQVIGGPNLGASKATFTDQFVQRPEFAAKYQVNNSADSFVDALLLTVNTASGVDLSSERSNLIDKYNSGPSVNASRSLVLRDVADNARLSSAVYNQTFVLMEYFGYLRRDPDQGGFDFWLNVLNNREPGNYRGMVCSFITSIEYQRRFSSVVSHSNAECSR